MSLTPALTPAALVLLLLATSATAADAVVEERPAHRSAVGRKIYTVPRDLADSGSVTDMLRGLPFVEIDADGEVSLRGDANVTILIDGRSSIELSPGWRALAVQRMPASTVESIEIMTGASAQFQSGGAGGVINSSPGRRASREAGSGRHGGSMADQLADNLTVCQAEVWSKTGAIT